MDTVEDLRDNLLTVNRAIQRLIAGEKIVEFEIGSGASSRKYKYGEVTIEALQNEKVRIVTSLNELTQDTTPFRKSSRVQTIHRKL